MSTQLSIQVQISSLCSPTLWETLNLSLCNALSWAVWHLRRSLATSSLVSLLRSAHLAGMCLSLDPLPLPLVEVQLGMGQCFFRWALVQQPLQTRTSWPVSSSRNPEDLKCQFHTLPQIGKTGWVIGKTLNLWCSSWTVSFFFCSCDEKLLCVSLKASSI